MKAEKKVKKKAEKIDIRFEIVKTEKVSMLWEATVLRDKQTGVQYLFVAHGYGGGLTPLLDKDGKPIISEAKE